VLTYRECTLRCAGGAEAWGGLGVTALLAVLPLFPKDIQKMRAEQQQVGSFQQTLARTRSLS
jgi:hypothetical protein